LGAALVLAPALGWAAEPASGECPVFEGPAVLGTVANPRITETSGLAVSRVHPDTLWVHNDSGHVPQVYAVGVDGRDLGTYHLVGVSNTDWEGLAIGPGAEPGNDFLYVGDIGDNNELRRTVTVYRVPEPVVTGRPGTTHVQGAVALELQYPDGPHDAEALLVDPTNGDLFIVTKEPKKGKSRVFRAPFPQNARARTRLERVAKVRLGGSSALEWAVTGGDLSAGTIVLRSYAAARWWTRAPGQSVADALERQPCRVPLAFPHEIQGEALGLAPGDRSYFTIGEGVRQAVRRFDRVGSGSGQAAGSAER